MLMTESSEGGAPKVSASVNVKPASEEPESKSTSSGKFGRVLRFLLGQKPETTLREVLDEVIEEHEENSEEKLEPEERLMLHNVLSFGDTQVRDIMVPRTDIQAVSLDITLPALKTLIMEHRHTRIPVYEGTLDHVRGFVHVKDLLSMFSGDVPYSLTTIMRNLLFVPPSMRIIDLLVKMRHAGTHMAIVVDEYGGTDGLITMEDLFEEIVGDIHDEHDDGEEPRDRIFKLPGGGYEVSSRIRIEKLEKELGLNLVTEENGEEFETLGGLIFFQLGRVPAKGEMVPHVSGIRFEIVEADARRIQKIRILTSA